MHWLTVGLVRCHLRPVAVEVVARDLDVVGGGVPAQGERTLGDVRGRETRRRRRRVRVSRGGGVVEQAPVEVVSCARASCYRRRRGPHREGVGRSAERPSGSRPARMDEATFVPSR